MAADEVAGHVPARSLPWLVQVVLVVVLCAAVVLVVLIGKARSAPPQTVPAPAASPSREAKPFVPSPAQLATFTVKPVEDRNFQVDHVTEGKINVNEDQTTPIFSQYSGRVIRLAAKAGDIVQRGQLLFTIEATDMVQAQNDLLLANGALNKAKSQLALQTIVEKRQRDLFESRAIAVKELQTAQNDLVTAQNDLRGAQAAFEAVRNRLAILGKTETDIQAFLSGGRMTPDTPVTSPIAGTVTQRRIGPGQFVSNNATDPAYTIGDLSGVWLIANVRESEAPRVAVGQNVKFRVLAFPDRTFDARISYVAASVDPNTRRVQVRAEVDNREGLLKPEMFASVRIATGARQTSPAVPREAVIYEADEARLWVVNEDGSVSLRRVKTGLVDGEMIQIKHGVKTGERVVTRGTLFIDRLASGSDSP